MLTLQETDYVCDYIRHGGDKAAFLQKFAGAYSEGFDPEADLRRVGVANQTTMMRGETEEVQRRIQAAIRDRDGAERAAESFRFFDTICGATQERQDALSRDARGAARSAARRRRLQQLEHLAPRRNGRGEIADVFRPQRQPARIASERILHYDQHEKREVVTEQWLQEPPVVIGVTAGASCPNNIIEETILRVFELHGVGRDLL